MAADENDLRRPADGWRRGCRRIKSETGRSHSWPLRHAEGTLLLPRRQEAAGLRGD